MDTGTLLLLVVALLSWSNVAVHYYTQFGTYALFPAVAAAGGGPGFVGYHREYERRLPVTVYAPWGALVLATAGLLVVRPDGLALGWVLGLLALNLSIAALSLAFAAPVHRQVDADGGLSRDHAAALLRWNAVRLAVATVSAVTAAVLLATTL